MKILEDDKFMRYCRIKFNLSQRMISPYKHVSNFSLLLSGEASSSGKQKLSPRLVKPKALNEYSSEIKAHSLSPAQHSSSEQSVFDSNHSAISIIVS